VQKAPETESLAKEDSQFDELAYRLDYDNIDLEEYRDLSSKIKQSTGYALLEVEPFPRMKIMKLGLIILEDLKLKIPEDAMFRIYMGRSRR
jgi:hypothetical protein